MSVPYSNMTLPELIRKADNESNELALAIINQITDGTIAVSALVQALVEVQSNVATFTENLATVLVDDGFDDIRIGEHIATLADDHGSPLSSELALAIDKFLIEEKKRMQLAIAQVWLKSIFDVPESMTLKSELSSSIEDQSVFSDLSDIIDNNLFDNPFQHVLDNYEKEQKEKREAEKLYRENLRINQPLPKRKRK